MLVGRAITMPIMDVHLVHSQNTTSFVFSAEPIKGRRHSAKFILVYYEYASDRSALPKSFFDYSIRYELSALRDPSCDGTVTDIRDSVQGLLSGYLTPTSGSPYWNQKFPPWDTAGPLDCYVVRSGKYKFHDRLQPAS